MDGYVALTREIWQRLCSDGVMLLKPNASLYIKVCNMLSLLTVFANNFVGWPMTSPK